MTPADYGALLNELLEAGVAPSPRTGSFHEKGLATRDWEARLALLGRGQAWVARRIAEALPGLADRQARRLLQSMYDSHLAGTPAQLASSNAA